MRIIFCNSNSKMLFAINTSDIGFLTCFLEHKNHKIKQMSEVKTALYCLKPKINYIFNFQDSSHRINLSLDPASISGELAF